MLQTIKSTDSVNKYLNIKCITHVKRVGRLGQGPRKIIATVNSYESKLLLLNSKNANYVNYENQLFDQYFERIQTKFGKFVLNINKFASNHAIRAELGIFPLNIFTDTKLIKYWHRLENLEEDSLLKQCYNVCKTNQHSWYIDVINSLNRNGLNYIVNNPQHFTEDYVGNEFKTKLENQYLQSWDSKSQDCEKLSILYSLKKNNYKRSQYLKTVLNINDRKKITKLRLGCSKLFGHKYLNKNENSFCPYCVNTTESLGHFLLDCDEYKSVRKVTFDNIENTVKNFLNFSQKKKISILLSFNVFAQNNCYFEIQNMCINYINELYNLRFKN